MSEIKTVSAFVIFNVEIMKTLNFVNIGGKIFYQAYERDSGARTGEDVALLEGNIDSGGSRNYWKSIVEEGSKFKVLNLIPALVKYFEKIEGIEIEIL